MYSRVSYTNLIPKAEIGFEKVGELGWLELTARVVNNT